MDEDHPHHGQDKVRVPPRFPKATPPGSLYQDDLSWELYLQTGHLEELDGPYSPSPPQTHVEVPPPRALEPEHSHASLHAMRVGNKFHADAMEHKEARRYNYEKKQHETYKRPNFRREVELSRLAAMNAETFNNVFRQPNGRPVVSNFVLDQTRQPYDYNPQGVASRARAEGRLGEAAPIYPQS